MKRVLVTGAGGFIGRQVLGPLLARGFEVHAVGRSSIPSTDVRFHRADLLDAMAIGDLVRGVAPTHLLHLAWDTVPGEFWTTRKNLDWVAASLRLYRAFVAAGGRRVVTAGTCAEYDWGHALLDEARTPCVPATLYGLAKRDLHAMLSTASDLDGVSFASGRVFFPYGPGERPGRLVSDVTTALLDGRPAETTPGSQLRDFVYVVDVARAFAALIDCGFRGAVNIASGIARPVSDVIARLGALTGRPDLLRIGARGASPGDPPRLAASVDRLRDEVGYAPSFDIDSGLAETVAWWRAASLARGSAPGGGSR